MKVEINEQELNFINNIMQNVKVNDQVVPLQDLLHIMQKLNTPIEDISKEDTEV